MAVTRVAPVASGLLVSDFADRADLVQALMTSCHIPFWLDGNAFTEFRGERSCDGGLTNFIPIPPGTVGVRVSCFPSKQLSPVYRWRQLHGGVLGAALAAACLVGCLAHPARPLRP